MSDLTGRCGIDMIKDSPYVVMVLSWIGDINWLFVASIAVAAFRGWVAYKEYKLKERVENANSASNEKEKESKK